MENSHEYNREEHEVLVQGDDSVSRVPISSGLVLVGLILLLIFGGGVLPHLLAGDEHTASVKEVLDETVTETSSPTESVLDPFSDLRLSATAAFVYDINTNRVLFQKQPDEQLPLASITKLMTALVAYETLAPDEQITVSEAALAQDGGGLEAGEVFTARMLLDLVLVTSSNDGAYALAEAAGRQLMSGGDVSTFVQAMNVRAEELALRQTYFRNPTGLDLTKTDAGAYGSARDVAFLLEHILITYPALLEKTIDPFTYVASIAGAGRTAYNTNQFVDTIPGMIGSKTGFTDLAGGNLAVAFNAGSDRPVIVVVLGSTRSQRFEDVDRLVNAVQIAVQQP